MRENKVRDSSVCVCLCVLTGKGNSENVSLFNALYVGPMHTDCTTVFPRVGVRTKWEKNRSHASKTTVQVTSRWLFISQKFEHAVRLCLSS